MKKTVLVLCVGFLLFAGSGCTTSTLKWTPPVPEERSSSGSEVVWNLEAVNNGIYLFYYIPVFCGSTSRANRGDYRFFRHLINERHAYRLLNGNLKKLKADDVEDVTVSYASNGWTGLGIFWSRSFNAKAKAVKKSLK